MMEFSPSLQEKIQNQFETFCRKVIDGERSDYFREFMQRTKRESLFSDLPESVLNNFSTVENDPAHQYMFPVCGYLVPIRDDRLAETLLTFCAEEYSILLLYYSLQLNDREISSMLGLSRAKVQKWRKRLLNNLRERMAM